MAVDRAPTPYHSYRHQELQEGQRAVFQHHTYPHVPTNQANADGQDHCSARLVAHTSCSDHPQQTKMDARLANEEVHAVQGRSRKGVVIRHDPNHDHTQRDQRDQEVRQNAEAMSCASSHAHGVCVTTRGVAGLAIDHA